MIIEYVFLVSLTCLFFIFNLLMFNMVCIYFPTKKFMIMFIKKINLVFNKIQLPNDQIEAN